MDKLACRIVPSDPKTFVVGTFLCYVGARVKLVVEWAFVRRGVSISLGDFTVIDLAVYELKVDGALLRCRFMLLVNGTAHRL